MSEYPPTEDSGKYCLHQHLLFWYSSFSSRAWKAASCLDSRGFVSCMASLLPFVAVAKSHRNPREIKLEEIIADLSADNIFDVLWRVDENALSVSDRNAEGDWENPAGKFSLLLLY